jgi:hypothetical protein
MSLSPRRFTIFHLGPAVASPAIRGEGQPPVSNVPKRAHFDGIFFRPFGKALRARAVAGRKWSEKNNVLYIYSRKVKVLDVFLGKRGFFGNKFLTCEA